MSAQIKDGGPAFPGEKNVRFGQSNDCNEGMTLRDYFAAKAMQSLIVTWPHAASGEISRTAYGYADAMLAAREVQS
jgi:hypothetical protein